MTAQTPPPDFAVRIVHLDDHAVVVAAGEIDLESAPAFEATLNEAVDLSPVLTIDMHNVGFMDSSGLSVLIRVIQRCSSEGGAVTLRGVRSGPLRLIEIAGIDTVMEIDPAGNPADSTCSGPSSRGVSSHEA